MIMDVMIKLTTVPIGEALIDVGINYGASLPHVIEIKNLDYEQIFRVLSEKKDCYFTVANNDCSCNQEKPCIHQQVVAEFRKGSACQLDRSIHAYIDEELSEREYLEQSKQVYLEQLIKERKVVEKEYEGLFYCADALDLDANEIVRAEKYALMDLEIDEYLEMDESMNYADKMSFLRLHTGLDPKNHIIDPNQNQ
jgi:hypothetical protein